MVTVDESKSSAIERSDHPETLAGDPFAYAGARERSHQECVEAMHAEEERVGREMTHREREAFAKGFHAPSYRGYIRYLAAMGVLDEEDEEA